MADKTIATSAWTVTDGLTVVSTRNASPFTIIWVSGGTEGKYYVLTNTITTNQTDPVSGQARQKQRSIGITVRFQ